MAAPSSAGVTSRVLLSSSHPPGPAHEAKKKNMSTLTPLFVQSGPLDDVLSAVASATDYQLKQTDNYNQTLLHGACARVDGLPIVFLLLKRGLDGNVRDAWSQTPLQVAKGYFVC